MRKSHWKWLPTPLRWCKSILLLYICYCPVLTSVPTHSDLCHTFTGRRPVLTCLNTSTWAPVDVRLNMNLSHKKGTPKWVCRLGQLTRWGKQTFIAKVTVEDPNLPWQHPICKGNVGFQNLAQSSCGLCHVCTHFKHIGGAKWISFSCCDTLIYEY